MSLFYGRNTSVSSALSKYSYIPVQDSFVASAKNTQASALAQGEAFFLRMRLLGNITKSHPSHTVQGFQRIHDFALRDRAGQILGKKSRVCGCGKRKIDKDLPRGVVYNEKQKSSY